MKAVLRIQHALSAQVLHVRESQRLHDITAAQSIADIESFAVFTEDQGFLGVVGARDATTFPERIFADLLTKPPLPLLETEDPLDHAVQFFTTQKTERAGVRNAQGAFCGVITSTSALKALFARVHRLAHYDPLTCLPNRTLLLERLQQLIASGAPVALAFIDLDNFKIINDALGHHAGDGVLTEIGRRLDAARRPQDMLGRFSGDAFVAVITDFDGDAALEAIVQTIFATLNGPVQVDGHEIFMTGSIGLACFPRDAGDAETLLRHAELAMYRAKEDGRTQWRLYAAEMASDATAQFQLQSQLRQAHAKGQFWLAWQPQVNLESGAIVGAEVLMRCTTPETGPIPPGTFIPLAEQSGLIVNLSEWAFEAVRRELTTDLAGLLPPGFRIAVNLSMSQLNTRIMRAVLDMANIIQARGLRLEVELTESALVTATAHSERFVGELADHAVEIAVDDFGTGYSNLTRLRELPVNRLKIAPSFTADLDEADSRSGKIIGAIIALGRALSIEVTAEGVERPEQAALLQQMGCDHAQGYWFARPMPVSEFAALLRG